MGARRLRTRSTRTTQTNSLEGPTERRKICSRMPSGVPVTTTEPSRTEATLNMGIQLLETSLLPTNLPIPQQLPRVISIIMPMGEPFRINMGLNRTSRISLRHRHLTEGAWEGWGMAIDPMGINTNSTTTKSAMNMGEFREEQSC